MAAAQRLHTGEAKVSKGAPQTLLTSPREDVRFVGHGCMSTITVRVISDQNGRGNEVIGLRLCVNFTPPTTTHWFSLTPLLSYHLLKNVTKLNPPLQ